jgi:hypothetical protein
MADILLFNPTTGQLAMWFMNGATPERSGVVAGWAASAGFTVAGTGDFDGDGKTDVLWHNSGTGKAAVWLMDGTTPTDGAGLPWTASAPWTIAGVGDLDDDGKDDVILHNTSTGRVGIWFMNGKTPSRGAQVTKWVADPEFSLAAVGDFDGNGKADLCWRNGQSGTVAFWLMDGETPVTGAQCPWTAASPWGIEGAGDLDGDGKDDIILRNGGTGRVAAWLMNGATPKEGAQVTKWLPPTSLDLAAIGDYDGDGKADITWSAPSTGRVSFWLMDRFTPTTGAHSPWTAPTPWGLMD